VRVAVFKVRAAPPSLEQVVVWVGKNLTTETLEGVVLVATLAQGGLAAVLKQMDQTEAVEAVQVAPVETGQRMVVLGVEGLVFTGPGLVGLAVLEAAAADRGERQGRQALVG
jgi:hypothetical protein